jgi:hypothetical protein
MDWNFRQFRNVDNYPIDKKDGTNDYEPKGRLSGFVDVEVKYEMSKFQNVKIDGNMMSDNGISRSEYQHTNIARVETDIVSTLAFPHSVCFS